MEKWREDDGVFLYRHYQQLSEECESRLQRLDQIDEQERGFWRGFAPLGLSLAYNFRKNNVQIFEVDNKVKKLLELTDNEPHETRLPFPVIIIPKRVIYKKSVFDGIILFEKPNAISAFGKDSGMPFFIEKMVPDIYALTYFLLSNGYYVLHYLNITKNFGVSLGSKETQELMPEANNALDDLCDFCLNFLDFINDPEVSIVEKHYTKYETNKIRKTIKHTPHFRKVVIRGHLKRYIHALRRGGSFSYSHRFWVRGHFRHMTSDYYKNCKGKTVWIYPYVKGQGILINKFHLVKQ